MKKINTEQLAELAMLAEEGNPIDWTMTKLDRQSMYMIAASNVIEGFVDNEGTMSEKYIIALASMTCLIVENTLLHSVVQGKS